MNATVLDHNDGYQASSFLHKLRPITRATKKTLARRDAECLRSAKKEDKIPHRRNVLKIYASAPGPDYNAGMCL